MNPKRAHPRIPHASQASFDAKYIANPIAGGECTVRDVCLQGLGLTLEPRLHARLRRGDQLTVHLAAGPHRLDLPGKVVYATTPGVAGPAVGVRLHLELSGQATRQMYMTWVQRLLRERL
jgi:hypothetical protein